MNKLLFLIFSILLTINAIGQDKLNRRIDFSVENILVSDALLSLCEKADLNISFKSNLFSEAPKIILHHQNQTIKFLLNACLADTEVGYKFENERIVLYQKPPPVFTIMGFVEDSLSGERLVAATIYDNISGKGTTTNEYGFYSLSIRRGKADLNFSYLGFSSQLYRINIRKNLHFNIALKSSITLQEIVVTDIRQQLQAGLSIESAPSYATGTLKKTPTLVGEPDVMRYFQTLPGVQSGAGGFGGLHIRGSEGDQNLVLLDGVPVYNPTHTLGLFSIFNENIIKSAQLYKGKFPAKYGGRLSSVMDIQTKEGNDKEFKFGGSVSLFATSVFAEGPIKKEKTAFFFSARRTFLDLFYDTSFNKDSSFKGETSKIGYYFYDFNAKVNHTFSEKDRVYISFYKGADNLNWFNFYNTKALLVEREGEEIFLNEQSNFIKINWGNTILSTRWNHLWSNKVFSNTTFTYSQFAFRYFTAAEQIFEEANQFISSIKQYNFDSNIQDIALKVDFDYIPNTKHHIKFGGGLLERVFKPILRFNEFEVLDLNFNFDFGNGLISPKLPFEDPRYYATELNAYLEDDIKINDKLQGQIGFHTAVFIASNKAYLSFQPRFSLQYQLLKSGRIYASYSKMEQFLHVLSPVGVSMPFDLWVPSTKSVRPQQSRQVVLGTDWKLPAAFTFGIEGYYKKLDHLITYQAGVNSLLEGNGQNFDWEKEVTSGQGWNYGLEMALERTAGQLNGYINYTYSKAERKFEGLSSEERFPFRFNRKNELKIGVNYQISRKFSLFTTWTYGSGQLITPRIIDVSAGGFNFDILQPDLSTSAAQVNNFRLPPNHHLDLNFSFHWPKKWGDNYFSIGVYNVYNRKNALFVVRNEEVDMPENAITREIALFPIFPSIRYAVKF